MLLEELENYARASGNAYVCTIPVTLPVTCYLSMLLYDAPTYSVTALVRMASWQEKLVTVHLSGSRHFANVLTIGCRCI